MLHFFKYQGAGNDFIIIDDRDASFNLNDNDLVSWLCDRHFGVGADGLMLLRTASNADFEMIYFNADGKQGSLCGNGGRCITLFAYHLGLIKNETHFLAYDGIHHAKLSGQNQVSLQMSDVREITAIDDHLIYVNTGSPHVIKQVTQLEDFNVVEEGRKVRYDQRFGMDGVNVNFVEWRDGKLYIRTYERGVENETLACGTGVTAAAIAASTWQLTDGEFIAVEAVGGSLSVRFERDAVGFSNIWKSGPAKFVFKGSIDQ